MQQMLSELDQTSEEKAGSKDKKQGGYPLKKSQGEFRSKEDVLKQMLQTAVSQERYEDAALIRDELKEFKKSSRSKKDKKKDLPDKKSN